MGDVIAGGSVAAGGGVFQGAVFVEKGYGDAVDLGFEGDGDVFAAEVFLEALVEGDQLGLRNFSVLEFEHIVDAEHGDGVFDLGKAFEGLRADALGGGVGIGQLRVLFFEILEFAEELVVIAVADFRLSLRIVEPVVVVDEPTQFRDARFGR